MATKLSASALVRAEGQTFANVRITQGLNLSPSLVLASDVRGVYVVVTRNNWPAAGCALAGQVSYDGGASWVTVIGPLEVPPYEPTPKEPNPTPAEIGYSWGDAGPQPTHARLVLNNHGTSAFREDFRIDIG